MRTRTKRRRVALAGGYWNLILGVILAASGAVAVLEAAPAGSSVLLGGGIVAVVGSLTLVLSGIGAIDREDLIPRPVQPRSGRSCAPASQEHPRLGELAVNELGIISQEQLDQALQVQQHEQRPLGGILVSMGIITPQQLASLLETQGRRSDRWGAGI